jgi:protein-S-isoprenylcysteine O-methyltransferase Ste14
MVRCQIATAGSSDEVWEQPGMKRNKTIFYSALGGALIGALAVQGHLHAMLSRVTFFSLDQTLWAHRAYWFAAAAGWVILSLYWEFAAANAAEAKKEESTPSRGVHVFLTSLAQLMVLAPITGLGRYMPVHALVMGAGLIIEAAGVSLALWARVHLGRNWSGRIAVKVEHELIRTGPYRYLRHPIYSGLLAMYIGPTLVTGEWLAVVGVAVVLIAYWRKIRLEEATLDVAFGADYESYRRTSWALIPGIY